MARGGHASPVAAVPALPKVSFQKIEDDVSTQPSGVHDGQARSFGSSLTRRVDNDFSDFHRPDQYIRHIAGIEPIAEPLEIDLERQVEYDMDEQDQEWLDAVNTERKKEQLDKVTYETKHIPKPDLALPSEDSTCAICDDSEGENSNAIVFCDGCNLAVHQAAESMAQTAMGFHIFLKGSGYVGNVPCPLRTRGGAFKQTTQGEWIHLLCAIWVPETRVSNDVFMEPIIGVEKIVKQRWKLKCTICGQREGACIQCAKQSCFLAFHVTCARKDKLLLPMKSAQGVEPGALTAYCDKHLPKEQADLREAALQAEEEDDEDEYKSAQLSKSARAYAKTYKPGPPLVPAIIIERILQYINKTTIRKKPDFVALMCRYWSLKREARRGAPLLKRLHLEPWTASTGAKMQGEEEKVMKLEQLQHLRKDLEDLRGLTQLSRKRETRKLRQAELIHELLSRALFLHAPTLRSAFERIQAFDRSEYFKLPVSKKEVPDYFDVVKNPMSWSQIEYKLDNHQYWDIQSFKDDIQLVLDNAVLYNKEGTPFHRTALRIQVTAQPILADLDQLSSSPICAQPGKWTVTLYRGLAALSVILNLHWKTLNSLFPAMPSETSRTLFSLRILSPLFSTLNSRRGNRLLPSSPPNPADKKRQTREFDKKRLKQRRELEKLKRAEKEAKKAGAEAEAVVSAPPNLRVPRTRVLSLRPSPSKPRPMLRRTLHVNICPTSATQSVGICFCVRACSETAQSDTDKVLRQRRPSATIPAPGDIPLVEHVGERDSFTMFEQGWILPAGQRRGGRAPIERSAAPPPKKKMRLDGGTSRLSVFSTAASENQTLQTGSPPPMSSIATTDADNSMDVDEESSRPVQEGRLQTYRSIPFPRRVVIPPPNVIRTPDGKVIIEELDTPAIRKEKSLRRKEERLAAEAAAAAAVGAASSSQIQMDAELLSPISPSRGGQCADADIDADSDADADADTDGASDLSALSDIENEPDRDQGIPERDERDQDMPVERDQGILERDQDMPVERDQDMPERDQVMPDEDQDEPVDNGQDGPADGKQVEAANGKRGKPAPPPSAHRPLSESARRQARAATKDLGQLVLPPGQKRLEPGTLVWAKAVSFPWWPATVFHDNDLSIPAKVLQEAQMQRKKRKGKDFLHIVRFYDKAKSWQYLSLDKMRELGESKELDQDMLSKNSLRQQKSYWKGNLYAECQIAYA
ncbi:hypothetical protein B0H13DRAFT_1893737 [Mycena leptocephala]|nr:hypothetical protein B0H13DRAFT_1893737 [Mycena leptocephala]